ncbi:hypothetical protein EDD15DRAFT_2193958 [Pisolithus albus]|nr:hypothetical protein EDD15DRAFT_2193958 [Pisolithus albus]
MDYGLGAYPGTSDFVSFMLGGSIPGDYVFRAQESVDHDVSFLRQRFTKGTSVFSMVFLLPSLQLQSVPVVDCELTSEQIDDRLLDYPLVNFKMSARLEFCLGVPGGCHEIPALHDGGYVHDLLYTSRPLHGRHLSHSCTPQFVVERFKTFIESDSALRTTFRKMFRHLGTHDSARYHEPIVIVAGVPFYGIIARFCGLMRHSPIPEILLGIHGVTKPSCGRLTPPKGS